MRCVLFCDGDDPSYAFQFSTREDWDRKIKETAATISQECPETRILAYLTNRKVGPKSDSLAKEVLKKYKLVLDVRDRSWFLDRVNTTAARENAAEELARAVADPFLANEGLASRRRAALTSDEQIAAVVYLGLQWGDDIREKGLTKLSYDALVRSALRHTSSGERMSRGQVYRAIEGILPTHDRSKLREYVNAALERMTERTIRHWIKEDEFCLTHQEVLRQRERLSQAELQAAQFEQELESVLVAALPNVNEKGASLLAQRGRRVIERFLLSQGEAFATAVTLDHHPIHFADLGETLIRDIGATPLDPDEPNDTRGITRALQEVVSVPSETMRVFLRRMADAYTLLAFLHETPDVQRAVLKLFGHGDVWLDTTVVLPLLAEALGVTEETPFTDIVHAARDCGLKLHATPGVIEEILGHLNYSLTCARTRRHEWRGRIPFLYWEYVSSGRDPSDLSSDFDRLRGPKHPEQDMSEFLEEEYGIHNTSLAEEVTQAEDDLRIAVTEEWLQAKEERAGSGDDYDPDTLRELALHDVENYVGVLVRRKRKQDRDYGYSAWWFTLDKIAFEMHSKLIARMTETPPDPPVLSADFFLKYLSLGPIRNRLSKDEHHRLPIAVYEDALDVPEELLEIAERIRQENAKLPSYVIRCKIRDALDEARQEIGPHSKGGLAELKKKWRPAKSR
ncbi:MAG: hypothetical protein JSU86_14325 [Phycisphaerales bacterium]|nr:MAG: hypothetical protein JSU86_14325 [Phycisphaerales bacterium]